MGYEKRFSLQLLTILCLDFNHACLLLSDIPFRRKTQTTKLRKTLMKSFTTVRSIALIVLASVLSGSFAGCGGNSEQRQSGTLATPIDAVEKAGELAGKAADAKQAPAKKK